MNKTELQQVRDALGKAYALSIGWTANYQFNHRLDEQHAIHKDTMDKVKDALAILDADLARVVEPVAWTWDTASIGHGDGVFCAHFQFAKPCADQRILNLTPLYATPQDAAAPSSFPTRIMDLLIEVADRKGTEFQSPWADGNGDPLQDDADAAISWINAKATPQEAAAPELLRALKYARRMVNASECDIAFIDSAIAKAEAA